MGAPGIRDPSGPRLDDDSARLTNGAVRLNTRQRRGHLLPNGAVRPIGFTTLVGMDSTWLVLLALALGLAVGAGFVTMLHLAERRGASAAGVVSPRIPDGIDQ